MAAPVKARQGNSRNQMAVKKSPTSRKGSVDSFAGLTAGLAHLTPSQRSMLFVLSDLGEPATIQMLSDRTGLHANSVRETLSVLMEAGLVRRSQVPSASRGRPAWEYETSVPADISAVMKEFTGFANSICHLGRLTSGGRLIGLPIKSSQMAIPSSRTVNLTVPPIGSCSHSTTRNSRSISISGTLRRTYDPGITA